MPAAILAQHGVTVLGSAIFRTLAITARSTPGLLASALLLASAGAAIAQPAGPVALPAAPADRPKISAANPAGDLAAALPAVPEAADPLAPLPPLASDDPLLLAPLAPLAQFDATPVSGAALSAATIEPVARYSLKLDGVAGLGVETLFRGLSDLQKGRGKPATSGQIAARRRADEATMKTILESEGYFAAMVRSAAAAEGNGRTVVSLTVDPGQRYRWAKITLDAIPPGREDLRSIFALKPGQPIRAQAVEHAEADYRLRLANIGFPFSDLGARDVELDDAARTGDYLLTGDAGPLARIRAIRLEGYAPFSVQHALLISRLKPGDRYSALLAEDFRRTLVATQLFGGVTLKPVDTGARNTDGSAVTDLVVTGNRGPTRLLAGQAGYATGDGVRVEASWRSRNLFPPEGALTVRAVAGTIEQSVGAELRKANFGQRDRTLIALAQAANETRPAFQAKTFLLSARLSRDSTPIWQKRWTWSGGVELIASDERSRGSTLAAGVSERQLFVIAALPLQVGFDATENLLDPTSGFRLFGRVSPEAALQGGLFRAYTRLLAEVSGYQGVAANTVIAGRLRIGSIPGIDRAQLAPTRRYYAGGGGSVRGYDYQGIGPRDAQGDPLGGRSLAEGSVEARYRFGDFGAVVFFDIGNAYAGTSPTFSGLQYGAGIGARYYTPFGPIRFDIARAINKRTVDPKFAIYISIGQAF
jgi:translocation and assembly module TamA